MTRFARAFAHLTPAQFASLRARLSRIASTPLGTFAQDMARARRAVRAAKAVRG